MRRFTFLLVAALSVALSVVYWLSNQPLIAMMNATSFYVALHFNKRLPKKNIKYYSVAPGIAFTTHKKVHEGVIPEWVRRKVDRNAVKIFAAQPFGLTVGALCLVTGKELLGVAMIIGSVGCLARGLHLLHYGLFLEMLRNRLRILGSDAPETSLEHTPRAASGGTKESCRLPALPSDLVPDVGEALRIKKQATARELVELTGLSRSTVLKRLCNLIDAGAIVAVGPARSPKRRYQWVAFTLTHEQLSKQQTRTQHHP